MEEQDRQITPSDIADGLAELFDGFTVGFMIEGISLYLGKALNDSIGDLKEEHEDPIASQLQYLFSKIEKRARQIEKIYKEQELKNEE